MDWNISLLPLIVPDQDQSLVLQESILFGGRILDKLLPTATGDTGVASFGLTVLAIRQAKAFDLLRRNGLQDQAVITARSIYETLINLCDVLCLNKDKPGQKPMTDAEKSQYRESMGTLFVEYPRAVNKRTVNALISKRDEFKRHIANGCALAWHSAAVASIDNLLGSHEKRITDEFKPYLNVHGLNRATSSWKDVGVTDMADDSQIGFPHIYQWCCNFSHSNFYAARLNLGLDKSGNNFGFAPHGDQFDKAIVWFVAYCLTNILFICTDALDAFTNQDREDAENLVAKFKNAGSKAPSKVPDM